MNTAGLLLREARRRRKKSLAQISKQTRIKEKFLEAIEASRWEDLPNFSVARGFAKNYAQAINIEPERIVALLRRDFPQSAPATQKQGVPLRQIAWTPKTTILVAAGVTILILGVYLGRQYLLFAAPPSLEISGISTQGENVLVSGKTHSGATVKVQGRPVLVGEDGTFSIEMRKDTVGLTVEVQATSRTGKKTIVREPVDPFD